ncbi:MAG: metallophosphoesterase [Sphingobacteriales bacterium]|nr:MAG: metallophosphoesterase [Sphingobacteriales bacterium]
MLNFSKQLKPQDSIPPTEPLFVTRDSALVPASTQYGEIQPFKEKLMGVNYRSDWGMPVMMKTFDINKTHGGFKIESLGGGKQTKSVTLTDNAGVEWKLRTIDKDPAQALPSNFRASVAKDFVQDLISASQPYAPLVLPRLEEAAMIPHTVPEFYFVPDDPSFGLYQKLFANKMCMLEKKNATPHNEDTKSTNKVLNNMLEDNDHVVDQNAVLRARLFDILIADWDRHFDQWRWGTNDTGKGKLYYPIPKDRDQALFHSDGALIKYVSIFYLPFLKGFRKDIPNVRWMGYSARDFDRVFMNRLGALDWQSNICELQKSITDTIISQAVHDLPPAIYNLSGPTIEEKLKSRRDLMMTEGMKYYEFLSEYVNVMGSNEDEYVRVSNSDSGLKVDMYSHNKGDTNFLMYSRVFDPSVTKEVRIFGLNGNDVINVDDDVHSKIKLRVIGGKGQDTFNMGGYLVKYIYDLNNGGNYVTHGKHTHNRFSDKLEVNDFNYKDYEFSSVQRYPYITGGYNTDDGILGGLVYTYRTYGFRKEPYGTENRLWGLYSFLGKAYQFKYNGTFIDVYKGLDILANFEVQDPVLYNFFGLGNETKSEEHRSENLYYNARFDFAQAEILFRQRFFKNKLSVMVGPSLYHYWNHEDDNEGKILANPEAVGLTYDAVYKTKTYLGVKAAININNLNSAIFPTRGVQWNNELLHQRGLGQSAKSYTRFLSDMTVYASLSDPAKLVAVLRFGGGKIFSDSFEYFQAVNLGSNNYLRGFRKNRFSGSSSLYNSVELRIKLIDIHSRIIPGTLGAIVFNDIGRVWYKNEDSNRWHDAYGGGFYFLPFRAVILSATVGRSSEESVLNFTIGTKLNLTF